MNILIIGNGGREHALGWKAAQSPLADKIFIAPGNAGTALEARLENVAIPYTDIEALLNFAQSHDIGLIIVGPEEPLLLGIVDVFQAAGLKIFGPSQGAAQLEGSKIFTKKFLERHNIPSAEYQCFTETKSALAYVQKKGAPIVIKADGLAGGKGVVVAITIKEAEKAVHGMLSGKDFGNAGHRIVVEECLFGEEASFIVMVDGKHIMPMATSQDYKRVGNGNTGPNTGGMGAYSPAPVVTNEIYNLIMDKVIWPTVHGMATEGKIYVGFLYAGLMITSDGQPKVIEFNCRLGDPETQPIMLRLRSDLVELCLAGVEGKLAEKVSKWDERPALGVVLASDGYPGNYHSGKIIQGIAIQENADSKIFHAGTCIQDGKLVTSGGRVLCITALGRTIKQAQSYAYQLTEGIKWTGSFCRMDIGDSAITLNSKFKKLPSCGNMKSQG